MVRAIFELYTIMRLQAFGNYRPSRLKSQGSGKVLLPVHSNKFPSDSSIKLIESRSNQRTDLILFSLFIVTPLLFVLLDKLNVLVVNHENGTSRIVFGILGVCCVILGLILLPEKLRKVISPEMRATLEVGTSGITYTDLGVEKVRLNWPDIADIAVKRFPESYGYSSYLLIYESNSHLIDIDISLLYDESPDVEPGGILKRAYIGEKPEYLKLRAILKHNLCAKR